LISTLKDHTSYVSHSGTHAMRDGRPSHASLAGMAGSYRSLACDFFKPFSLPVEGFEWLWQIIAEQVACEPHLYISAFTVFQELQWLECEVSANRRGEESASGSRRLLHVPKTQSKRAVRRAFAAFLMLGLGFLRRGHIDTEVLLTVFSSCTQTSAQAPEGLVGRRRNLLHIQPAGRSSSPNYVDCTDVVAAVMSSVSDDVRSSLLASFPSFQECQWAFSVSAVRSLSDAQQLKCVQDCTFEWLTGEMCTALRGEACHAARAKLALRIGCLDAEQQAFMWGGV